MPLTVRELNTSREFTIGPGGASLTREWMVYRTDDETAVLTEALTANAVIFDGLVRGDINPKPIGGGVWLVSVEYRDIALSAAAGAVPGAISAPPDDDTELGRPQGSGGTGPGIEFSFDISQNATHVTQSLETLESKSAGGGVPPDYKKAIGVTKDGVAGCDIFDGKLEVTVGVTRASCKFPYIRTLRGMVGKTNNAKWYEFARGEVLYLGASGQAVQDGITPKFKVTHRLGVGENQVNIDVGNGITILSKRAWEYLWVTYAEKEVGGLLLQVPSNAYVERVFREANFNTLELG